MLFIGFVEHRNIQMNRQLLHGVCKAAREMFKYESSTTVNMIGVSGRQTCVSA